MASGNITRTPDYVLDGTEDITNEKINRTGSGVFRVDEGAITDRELSVSLTGGFDTVAELRANTDTFTDNTEVNISGYYTDGAGDFGPPLFVDTGDTTTADDDVTCFVDANGLRFKRELEGVCFITWAGGRGNDSLDNSSAMATAISALPSDGGVIGFPAGDFRFSTSISDSSKSIQFVGAGVNVTNIKPTADIDVFTLNTNGSKIKSLTIDGSEHTSNSSNAAIHIGSTAVPYFCEVKDVFVQSMAGNGLRWSDGPNLRTEGLLITNVQGHGVYLYEEGFDNNHGLLHFQVTRAGVAWDAGEATYLPVGTSKYGLYAPNGTTPSKHHVYQNIKIFGCPYGGAYIGTDFSEGSVFVENNNERTIGKVTFTNATNVINRATHGLSNGDQVYLGIGAGGVGGGTMPTGLTAETRYYVVNSNTNDFQVSLTSGGSAVTFSDDGAAIVWLRELIASDPTITFDANANYNNWYILGDVTDGGNSTISNSGLNRISYIDQGYQIIDNEHWSATGVIGDASYIGRQEKTFTADQTLKRSFEGSPNNFIENWEHSTGAGVDMRANNGSFLLNGFSHVGKSPTVISSETFTTDYATDANQIDATGHDLENDDVVRVETTNTLPSGLSADTTYWVVNKTTNAFELSTTQDGSPVTLSSDGTGTHTFTKGIGHTAGDIFHSDVILDATNGALNLLLGYYVMSSGGGRQMSFVRTDSSSNSCVIDGGVSGSFGGGDWRKIPLLEENKTVTLLNTDNAGTPRWRVLNGSFEIETTWDPASLSSGSSVSSGNINYAVNGPNAYRGNWYVIPGYDLQELTATVNVTSSSSVEIILSNLTGGAVDLGSGDWIVGMNLL